MADQVINHPKYGQGVVKQTRHKGFDFLAEFADGALRWVRADELDETPSTLPVPSLHRPSLQQKSTSHRHRAMIEAFRLGIVPDDCVEDLTFGRQSELSCVRRWLSDQVQSSLLVVGEYGSGKTHILQAVRAVAIKEGFAVAHVELDPNEAPFYKPKRIYHRFAATLQYRALGSEQQRGFRDFMQDVVRARGLRDHAYFRVFRDLFNPNIMPYFDWEPTWNWIEAREPIHKPSEHLAYPGLPEYATAANVYCYLLSGLGWAAREVLHLKGLVLIFDEAETVDVHQYNRQIDNSYNFLKALIRTAAGDPAMLRNPEGTGLHYRRTSNPIPFLYRVPSGLKLIFAFTPSDMLTQTYEMESLQCIELESLREDSLTELYRQIRQFYNSAYDFRDAGISDEKVVRLLVSRTEQTRMFVKGAVETLDLLRFHPNVDFDEVLQ